MIKTKSMFLLTCTLLLCSCESLFESNKEKLDKLVAAHWEKWKAEGKDTTMCTSTLLRLCHLNGILWCM